MQNYISDLQLVPIAKKSRELFKESTQNEDIALWISLGVIFDSSAEYGELLNHAMAKINENPYKNLEAIKEVMKKLSPEDSFIRAQSLNLVNQMNVSSRDKVNFFGNEMQKKVHLNADGGFSDDSLNITTAMIMFKNVTNDPQDILYFAKKSFSNNEDPIIREKLMARYKTYFPSIANEI